jgi:4-hydroxy-3-methylbut-2-enyl diphosphate reductase
MEILPVVPRGYCQGVVRAIEIARKTAHDFDGTPITMLGMIVHNRYVVDACRNLGIRCLEDPMKTRLQLLDEIDSGIVIFTAHGVSDEVRTKAREKGLQIVDATCPDVMKTHELVLQHCKHGGEVLYIGKAHHPEAEGTVSLDSHIHLIAAMEDIHALPDDLKDILITSQTTVSQLEMKQLLDACKTKYPNARIAPEICNATAIRQQAVMNLRDVDVLLVVGDPHSNNSNQLRNIAMQSGIQEAWLVEGCWDLKETMVRGKERIAVTSGSSTPTAITSQVIDFLKQYAQDGIWCPPQSLTTPVI